MFNKTIVKVLAMVTSAVMLSGVFSVCSVAPSIVVEAYDAATNKALRENFDATFYANKYADVKNAFGTNADALFNHFLNNGMKEGRMMNSNFDPNAYIAAYADIKAYCNGDLTKAYIHYVTNGKREGRNLTTFEAINAKKAAEAAKAQAAADAAAKERQKEIDERERQRRKQEEEQRERERNTMRTIGIGHGLSVTLNNDQFNSCSISVMTNGSGFGAYLDGSLVSTSGSYNEGDAYPYSVINISAGNVYETIFDTNYHYIYQDLLDVHEEDNMTEEDIEDALLLALLLSDIDDDAAEILVDAYTSGD